MSAIPDSTPVVRASLPSGTITFAFTDIEGSTQRWDRDAGAMEAAVRRHDALVRAAIAEHDGVVFKALGDAFCAAFWRPVDAVAAMLAAQRALAAEDFSAVNGLRVRAAVHTGTADERDGDYFGPVLNRVARLLAIGHGGQVLVSGVTGSLLAGVLPVALALRDLGEHRLKDLIAPERVYTLVAPDLPSDHPPLRSLDAHANNLPLTPTTLIGRETQIAEIAALLASHRLVTIVGAGGIGKTRISLQVAANLLDGSGDGVWFIELATLSSGDYLAATIANELGITLGTADGTLAEQLVRALANKNALLVLDNCEHIVDAVASVVTAIVRRCPHVSILASSRQNLNVDGEQTYRLPSLEVPQADAAAAIGANEAARFAAVSLFVERAQSADRRFALTDANAATIVEICRRLDGIALAIELAAARIKILSPKQLTDRLNERFRVLTGGSRDVLPRQQTLRALIDWSYDLLDERERLVFRRIAMFVNGFGIEAAAAVAGGEGLDEFDLLDVVTSLADKSLVLADTAGDSSRYRMLESTRAYALERLRAAGETDTLASAHAIYFGGLAGDWMSIPAKGGPAPLALVEVMLDDMRQALRWALEERHDAQLGARLACDLSRYWAMRLPREGQRWLDVAQSSLGDGSDVLLVARVASAAAAMLPHGSFERIAATERALDASRAAPDRRLLSKALSAYGEQLAPRGRSAEAATAFTEALELAQAIGSEWDAARALAGLGRLAVDGKDVVGARRIAHETIAIFERIGAFDGVAYVWVTLGQVEFLTGNVERAIELTRNARTAYGELRNNRSSAWASSQLAAFAIAALRYDEARLHARDVLQLLDNDRHPLYFVQGIECLAHLATLRGDARRGALLQGYSNAACVKLAFTREGPAQWCYERHEQLLAQALPGEALATSLAAGAALTEPHALQEALAV